MADIDSGFRELLDRAGVSAHLQEYLAEIGVRHSATFATLFKEPSDYVREIVEPFCTGIEVKGKKFKSEGSKIVDSATITVAAENAKVERRLELNPKPTTTTSAITSSTTTSATATGDTDKAPKTLAPGKWQQQIDRYQAIYKPMRKFPVKVLMGAEGILARLLWEHQNKNYTLLQLGEILQARSFTSLDDINPLSHKSHDAPLSIEDDGSLAFRKARVYEPSTLMILLDALDAVKWGLIFCEYGSEEAVHAFVEFFAKHARQRIEKIPIVRELWNASYWRLATDMRQGVSFEAASKSIMCDTTWVQEQLAKDSHNKRKHPGNPTRGGKGNKDAKGGRGGKSKGKGKGNKSKGKGLHKGPSQPASSWQNTPWHTDSWQPDQWDNNNGYQWQQGKSGKRQWRSQ